MTDKELRKLGRLELLEILVRQADRIEELEHELEAANERLESREIEIAKAGSLADAAVQISALLESAQLAADLYLENAKRLCDSGKLS